MALKIPKLPKTLLTTKSRSSAEFKAELDAWALGIDATLRALANAALNGTLGGSGGSGTIAAGALVGVDGVFVTLVGTITRIGLDNITPISVVASNNIAAGGTVSGTNITTGGNTIGNSATTTKFATARNINGVAFDGTADITITAAASSIAIGAAIGSGTAGSVLYIGAGTLLAQDNANFKYDYINHRLQLSGAASVDTFNIASTAVGDGGSVECGTNPGAWMLRASGVQCGIFGYATSAGHWSSISLPGDIVIRTTGGASKRLLQVVWNGSDFVWSSAAATSDTEKMRLSNVGALSVQGNISAAAGNVSASGTVTGSNLSGTNTGDQTITLTGDVTGTGTGSFAATIAAHGVTAAKFRQSVAFSVVGVSGSATADVADISTTTGSDAVLRESGGALGWGVIKAAAIGSGTIAQARLGSGTTDNTTVLRGDSTWVAISSLGSVLAAAFDPASAINPLHYWKASNVVTSGGLVDTITDSGRTVKSFTQTGAARCPTATDGSGHTYLAPDGANDYYTAGAAADWTFLSNGAPYTIGFIWSNPADPGASNVLASTTNFTNKGADVMVQRYSSSSYGPRLFIGDTSGGSRILDLEITKVRTDVYAVVMIIQGQQTPAGAEPGFTPMDARMYLAGALAGAAKVQSTPNAAAPPGVLTLFRPGTTASNYYGGRLYEMFIEDRAIPDDYAAGYARYAAATYGAIY